MATLREAIELGIRHQRAGRLRKAEEVYRQVLRADPREPNALHLLGLIAKLTGRNHTAADLIEQAIAVREDAPDFHANLGSVYLALGMHDKAVKTLERAVELRPEFAGARSSLLLVEQSRPGVTLARLRARHAEWNERHAASLRSAWKPFANDRDPERPLRLGFVSPDLWQHPVGNLVVQFLETLDPAHAAAICYACRVTEDDTHDRIVRAAETWRDVRALSDDALDARIRQDEIDILFDMAGHTARNRLLVFARRPAPIQLSWIGYVGTTGLSAMDYVLADRYHVPKESEEHYCERIIRLPDGYICFDPPSEAPEVGPLPALRNGFATFGCFNNPSKISPELVASWSKVLKAVPGSRLVLKYRGFDEERMQERLRASFGGNGVEPERIDLLGGSPRGELLSHYNEIDIGLDSQPYSGGLTTCEALWMGVPVVTCPGETFASRHSLSHLSNAGLPELAVESPEAFVDAAVDLANNPERLADLRAKLRDQVAASPLCDSKRFSRNLMSALRGAWREWCETPAATDPRELSR